MAWITGKLSDIGLSSMADRHAILRFRKTNPAVGNQTILATAFKDVTPDDAGNFADSIAADDNLRPDTTRTRIEVIWLNGENVPVGYDVLPWLLKIPSTGGAIGDIIRTPTDDGWVFIGDAPPIDPSGTVQWIDSTTGDLYEWNGSMWVKQTNLRLATVDGTPRMQNIGSNLNASRDDWPGPVYWMTTAASGHPINAIAGDMVLRVSASTFATVWIDDFNRADGVVGTAPIGGQPWVTQGPGFAGRVSGNTLVLTGGTSDTGYCYINGGTTFGRFTSKIAVVGNRTGSHVFRYVDINNHLLVAHRVSAVDNHYRLMRRVGGVATQIAVFSQSSASGDIVSIEGHPIDTNRIIVKINGAVAFDGDVPYVTTGTRHGVAVNSTDMTVAFDDAKYEVPA